MSLILEIEFLTGAYRGTNEPGSAEPDWPPQWDRVNSALVSSWAARGEHASERSALEWLERQPAPTVHASDFSARSAPEVFVPPNDDSASRTPEKYLRVLPERRRRQPRRFPAAVPEKELLAYSWHDEPGAERMRGLESLARDVAYIGHSASLTRCRFVRGPVDGLPGTPRPSLRGVYPGRLAELEQAHRTNPVRPTIRPGDPVFPAPTPEVWEPEPEWLVLEIVAGRSPGLLATPLVCRLTRDALMSGYRRAGLGDEIPELVSGHAPDRTPARNPHLAIAPLAFIGSPYADGGVHGLAVVPPRGTDIAQTPGFRQAFLAATSYDQHRERRVLTLDGPPLAEPLCLAPAASAARSSLSPVPYRRRSRVWASVTPIVLDRHRKKARKQGGDAEVREIIASSCRNIGLPPPDPARIQVGAQSAFAGAAPARPPRGTPPWTRWRVPKTLSTRSLFHAVIDFGEEIEGPVLLGAGRFTGLGLCRRLGG